MQTITSPTTFASQPEGIVVRSTIKAGLLQLGNHSEGIVVRSDLKAGGSGNNHSEGVVVRSDLKAGGVLVPE